MSLGCGLMNRWSGHKVSSGAFSTPVSAEQFWVMSPCLSEYNDPLGSLGLDRRVNQTDPLACCLIMALQRAVSYTCTPLSLSQTYSVIHTQHTWSQSPSPPSNKYLLSHIYSHTHKWIHKLISLHLFPAWNTFTVFLAHTHTHTDTHVCAPLSDTHPRVFSHTTHFSNTYINKTCI